MVSLVALTTFLMMAFASSANAQLNQGAGLGAELGKFPVVVCVCVCVGFFFLLVLCRTSLCGSFALGVCETASVYRGLSVVPVACAFGFLFFSFFLAFLLLIACLLLQCSISRASSATR
jgi:hypothetical protein